MKIEATNTTHTIKKVWQKPDFYLLDTDDINAKTRANFHEGTVVKGAPFGFPGFYVTPAGNAGFPGTKNHAYS